MSLKLSILIATHARREKKLKELLDVLMRQVDKHQGAIEVVAYWNSGELSIGEIRQALLEDAQGEYVCFVDDDDMVPEYYCDEIVNALGEDYVGFQVALYNDGELKPPVYHSLKYPNWFEAYDGYYRNVTHLNPIKRELALQGTFVGGAGEDEKWASMVHPQTENYIDRVMYFYYHSSLDSTFVHSERRDETIYQRLPVNSPYFRYYEKGRDENDNQVS